MTTPNQDLLNDLWDIAVLCHEVMQTSDGHPDPFGRMTELALIKHRSQLDPGAVFNALLKASSTNDIKPLKHALGIADELPE